MEASVARKRQISPLEENLAEKFYAATSWKPGLFAFPSIVDIVSI